MPRLRRTGDWAALGEAVRQARVRAGYSSGKAFAEQAGINQGTYYNLETGRPIADAKAIQVTEALGWPPGRWLEILDHRVTVDDAPAEDVAERVVFDVPFDEWQRLSEDDRQMVRELITRLASEG